MFKSRPLLLLVVTLCLVMVALASFWLAALPHRMLVGLQKTLQQQTGLQLEARNPSLSFVSGTKLQLEDVTLQGKTETNVNIAAQDVLVRINIATLFGAQISAREIELQNATVSLDIDKPLHFSVPFLDSLTLRDSALRLRDSKRKAVVTIGDVNGRFFLPADGSLKSTLTFLLNGTLTTFSAEIESRTRLTTDGSPADIVVSAKDKLLGLSGRAKWADGLDVVGQSTIEASDTAAFLSWLGMPLLAAESFGPIKLQSGISIRNLSAKFENIDARLGDSNLAGTLNVTAGPDRMSLAGDVAVSRISLFGNAIGSSVFAKAWSETPFSISTLNAIDMNLNVKAAMVQLRGRDLGGLEFKLTSDAGITSMLINQQPFASGEVEANLSLEPANGILSLRGSLQTIGVEAAQFLGGLFGFDKATGSLDLIANFSAQGTHPAALISSLKGDLEFSSKALTLKSIDLFERMVSLAAGWNASDTTATVPVQVALNANVGEGVLDLQRAEIRSAAFSAKPQGEIDLLRQVFTLDLKGRGKGIDPKVLLTGHWNNPKFELGTMHKEKSAAPPTAN